MVFAEHRQGVGREGFHVRVLGFLGRALELPNIFQVMPELALKEFPIEFLTCETGEDTHSLGVVSGGHLDTFLLSYLLELLSRPGVIVNQNSRNLLYLRVEALLLGEFRNFDLRHTSLDGLCDELAVTFAQLDRVS
jgi:hypothetical protein